MRKSIFIALSLLLFSVFAFCQNRVVTGIVTDEKGNAVELASITIIGTRVGTTTDANGFYRLPGVAPNSILRVSGVGITPKEVNVGISGPINISVIKKDQSLACVTVVTTALGIKRMPKELGYAAGKLTNKSINSGTFSGYISPAETKYFSRDDEENFNTEEYSNISENCFHKVSDDPLSTFSIDVDAASYSNVRRFLTGGQLPPAGAVRTEEMINYFKYQYPQPTGKDPFSINTEISDCPWNKDNKLVLIGLQGKNIPTENLPASNLVFLIDVSGSMYSENKLPLVKASLKMLTDQLRDRDRISIVVYAGNAGLVLPPTSGADKLKIKTAIDKLEAGGSTAGGAGIQLAYKTAQDNFMKDGNNRIILCTDGDFNIGESSDDALVRLIETERKSKIYLTVLGYGMGNYKDSKMEQLADKGNGNHAYIDGINEAKKVLVNEFGGTLFTIAKDVKLQLEFNPAKIAGYRLIGYENRLLNKEDFNDDKKDAGELGSGHTVTALYEVIPAGVQSPFLKNVDPLKYQNTEIENDMAANNDELLTVKFRYKSPDSENSDLIVHPVKDEAIPLAKTSDNFRFAAAVADFAMILRSSIYKGAGNYTQVLSIANSAAGTDAEGYRKEFISLVKKASALTDSKATR